MFPSTSFINKADSSRDLIIFMLPFICLLEIIKFVLPNLKIFLWIAASVADYATFNLNGVKILLANSLNEFPIKGNKKIQFLVMILKVYLKILLIVLFYATEFLIILY